MSLFKRFKYAIDGILYAFRSEQNMRIHFIAAGLAVLLGILCHISRMEWAVITISIALVIGAELINTAIEKIVDLVSPEYHVLAKRAKDCAAGAVFIFALLAIVNAGMVFIPVLLLSFL